MHTGYLPTASVKYPAFGSIVAQQTSAGRARPAGVRANWRQLARRQRRRTAGHRVRSVRDAGGRQAADEHRAGDAGRSLHTPARPARSVGRRTMPRPAPHEVAEHQKLYQKASRMILSSQMKAFDLDQEPAAMREAYGDSQFGLGCLLGPAAGRNAACRASRSRSVAGTRTSTTSPASRNWPARSISRWPTCSPT